MAKRKRKSPKTEATEPAEKAEAAETEAAEAEAAETEAAEAEAAPDAADEKTPAESPAESTAETPGEPEDQPAADPGREETPEGPEEEPDPEALKTPGLEALKAEVAELNDKLLRALAEAENVRRRAERDKKDASKYAIANFARDMVGVADNLHRAMAAVDEETRKEVTALDQMMVGLELTEREILNTFERFGITKIEALGKKFDHNFHEAMFEIDDDQKPAGTVIQVVETGYVLNDRLLKPAKVGVAKGGPPANPEETDQAGADETPQAEAARKDGQTAYETKGKKPGTQLDEEL
ncbi:MAG: nucleotide exchange factor GrpE [Proteobacteria bacterium]|nr:nucleotide exchange factor GrpE [Pseudomonadota bacterium]